MGHGIPMILVLVLMFADPLHCLIEEMALPGELETCFRGFAMKTSVTRMVGEGIGYYCHQQYAWKQSARNNWIHYNMTSLEYEWFSSLLRRIFNEGNRNNGRYGHPVEPEIRMRKEIRALTDRERDDYFRAIQLLKADTSIPPNKYDAFAALHQGISVEAAHGGPNFLGWHRIYLLMYENALREKVPSVTIPYWASTLDSKMPNPVESVIWSELFLGNGVGLVRTGPFADWMTESGPLIRNIGDSGGYPFREEDIVRILSQSRTAAITEPNALPENNLEFFHGRVHDYIDGQMAVLATSSQDPVFFMHHAFVDFVWEVFRMQQRMKGINPEMDYPEFVNDTTHQANSPLGFGNILNIDSYSDKFIKNIYGYVAVPSCTTVNRDCGSPYLRCEVNNGQAYCVSADNSVLPQQPRQNTPVELQQASAVLNRINNLDNNLNLMSTTPPPQFNNNAGGTGMNMMMQGTQNNRNIMENIQNANNMMNNGGSNFQSWQWSFSGMPHGRKKRAMHGGMTPAVSYQQTAGHMRTMMSVQALNQVQGNEQGLHSRFHGGMMPGMLDGNILANTSSSPPAMPSLNGQCPAIPTNQAYQNTYNLNMKSDVREWVYVPLKIIHRRPPNFKRYTSYPIMDDNIFDEFDIYSPSGYQMLKERFKFGKLATYPTCPRRNMGAGRIFIQSSGINYLGTYKEFAIIDERVALSMATGYVAVKSPEKGATEVMISAFDSCGRVCTPYCRMTESKIGTTRPCSGAIRVTSDIPKMYGRDYGEALMGAWTLTGSRNCPRLDENHIFLSFYCDYQETWPFIGTEPPPNFQKPVFPMNMNMDSPQPQMMNTVATAFTPQATCTVGLGCTLSGQCMPCTHGEVRQCEGSCTTYALCKSGMYFVEKCMDGRVFDKSFGHCRAGDCMVTASAGGAWPKDPDSGD